MLSFTQILHRIRKLLVALAYVGIIVPSQLVHSRCPHCRACRFVVFLMQLQHLSFMCSSLTLPNCSVISCSSLCPASTLEANCLFEA